MDAWRVFDADKEKVDHINKKIFTSQMKFTNTLEFLIPTEELTAWQIVKYHELPHKKQGPSMNKIHKRALIFS